MACFGIGGCGFELGSLGMLALLSISLSSADLFSLNSVSFVKI
jgi:hypothetical protein